MKKRLLILFLLATMCFIPHVKAGYNGASGNLTYPKGTTNCDKSWKTYCLWNADNTKGLQVTLYYFDSAGNKTQIGKQIHVINNSNCFQGALGVAGNTKTQVVDWLSGVIIDTNLPISTCQKTWSFDSAKLRSYFLNESNLNRYIENYIGVKLSDLTLPSQAPAFNAVGYRLVLEPMYSAVLHEVFSLKTVKELAQHGISNRGRYESISASLYLEHDDVGITRGNSSGTTNQAEIANERTGWGYNIIDISQSLQKKCEWTTATSCCTEKNNLTGAELENFKLQHPACFDPSPAAGKTTTCDFKLRKSIKGKCEENTTTHYIKDIADKDHISEWGCIYESSSSDNDYIKNYFLKYGSSTSSCAVYCRDEIEYTYPNKYQKKGMTALAGTYFTLANNSSSYKFDVFENQLKFTAAKLGPIRVSVTRQCSITGTPNNDCNTTLNTQLNNLDTSIPKIKFSYKSGSYDVSENLKAEEIEDTLKTIPAKGSVNEIKERTITYSYILPDNNTIYKYVSKSTGTSFSDENKSQAGVYPIIEIGPHFPIHYSETNKTIPYVINITKFNLSNFDSLVINGIEAPKQFKSSIETYIKTLITEGKANPTKIGNIYYLNSNFTKLLSNKGYSIANFLYMSCANTKDYTCHSNANGIFCYDKGKTSNSKTTYAYFNSCIKNAVNGLSSKTTPYKNDLKYDCAFDVVTTPDNPGTNNDDDTTTTTNQGFINVIFRPISLDNPFPSIDGDGRNTGINWCYGNDCSNTNQLVKSTITNNREVQTESIYKERGPLYKIILTPSLIKEIRKYNDETSYDDFNLECDNDGNNCKSNFIRSSLNYNKYDFSTHFSGCGISGKQIDEEGNRLECADDEEW